MQGLRLLRTASIPGPAVQHAARAQRLTDYMVSKGSMGLQVAVVISQPKQAPPQAPVVTEQLCAETATVTGACRNCAVHSETVTCTCKCRAGGMMEGCLAQRMSMVLLVIAVIPAITLQTANLSAGTLVCTASPVRQTSRLPVLQATKSGMCGVEGQG